MTCFESRSRRPGLPSAASAVLTGTRENRAAFSIKQRLQLPTFLLALALSVSAVFAVQLMSQFRFVTGDRLDGLIQISILEHWFNVVRGHETWDTTAYFYPHPGTLAYNDGYFLYGLAYALFRAIGFDPFLAAEAVFITLRVLGFATAYRFAVRGLGLGPFWAMLGAALFTLSISTFQQSAHSQILSVALAPSAGLLSLSFLRALERGQQRAALGWGTALAALTGAWLLTAFYMIWLLAFFAAVLSGASLILRADLRDRAFIVLRREWKVVLATTVVFAAASLPFLALYLPKAQQTGMHSFAALRPYLPTLGDTIRLGPGDVLFGWADRYLGHVDTAERIVGWPPVQIGCFLAAALSWRRWPAGRPVIAAIVAVYVLTLTFHGATGWRLVYRLVPGAKAIRVVARAWIMLAGPVLCVVLLWLQRVSDTRPALAAVLALLLVAEQISTGPNVAKLDRTHELGQLDAILPPPPECGVFAVLSARSEDPEEDTSQQTSSANANAMLIAEVAQIRTINGTSTFHPPDWDAAAPSQSSYLPRLAAYARSHGLERVCGADLRTGRWYRDLSDYRPIHLVATGGPLSLRMGGTGDALLGDGWFAPEAWGRWGGPIASLRFLPQGGRGTLRMTVWAAADAPSPARPHRVLVLANGHPAAIWAVSANIGAYQLVLQPPADAKDPFEVTFVDQDAANPVGHDGDTDSRKIGLGLVAVQLDRM